MRVCASSRTVYSRARLVRRWFVHPRELCNGERSRPRRAELRGTRDHDVGGSPMRDLARAFPRGSLSSCGVNPERISRAEIERGESRHKSAVTESIETSRALFALRVHAVGDFLSTAADRHRGRVRRKSGGRRRGSSVPRRRSLNAAVLERRSNDMLKGRQRGDRRGGWSAIAPTSPPHPSLLPDRAMIYGSMYASSLTLSLTFARLSLFRGGPPGVLPPFRRGPAVLDATPRNADASPMASKWHSTVNYAETSALRRGRAARDYGCASERKERRRPRKYHGRVERRRVRARVRHIFATSPALFPRGTRSDYALPDPDTLARPLARIPNCTRAGCFISAGDGWRPRPRPRNRPCHSLIIPLSLA